MKFQIYLLVLASAALTTATAQQIAPPHLEWQATLGAGSVDQLRGVQQTLDGGFIAGGFSNGSTNTTKQSTGFGGLDYWIVRVNASGQYLWDKSFGGTGQDYLRAIKNTADGGVILGGQSNSEANGNKTSSLLGSGILDLGDFWVVQVDASGNRTWDKSYGGTDDDVLLALQQTSDGGFVLGGYSYSEPGGNKTAEHHGLSDYWIVRLDADGDVLWDRSFGGDDADILYALQETSDGGFIAGGISRSGITGNKTNAPLGNEDVWVVRLDSNGNKLWDRSFGGTGIDGLYSLQQLSDTGFILGCYSASTNSGNKTSTNYGVADFWLVRLDANGEALWDRSFGGTRDDQMLAVRQTPDGGFVLGGYSYSRTDGNKSSGNFSLTDPALNDFWLIRLNSNGDKLWEQVFGGTGFDTLQAITPTADGGWILGGDSSSPISGNKTSPSYGQQDFWLVKLGPDALSSPPRLTAAPQTATQISTSGFRMHLHGVSNVTYVVDGSDQFTTWFPVQTNLATGLPAEIVDPNAMNAQRFYRARLAQ